MRNFRASITGVLFSSFFVSFSYAMVDRPPQYIAMAFDNCTENERWEELSDFVKNMEDASKPVKFTFFVSGVNLIKTSNRSFYQGPGHRAGTANIDFGGDSEDIQTRLKYMHQLSVSGHELASHAVGHFSGLEWSKRDWLNELTVFKNVFQKAFEDYGYEDAESITEKVKGFRAPYLDSNDGMYQALSDLGYRYDTSSPDGEMDAWPYKNGKLWMFPLTQVSIAETGARTISMDYNFYARQSGAEDDPRHYEDYKRQMLKTYMNYFQNNYRGNRAPMNIGHHFFNYQGGVYNKALKEFASQVCGLPEVKCVSYSELADVMDSVSDSTLRAYNAGNFDHATDPL